MELEEFQSHAVSRRRLVRCDDGSAAVRGLLDTETGERFLIEDEKLWRTENVPTEPGKVQAR